MNEREAKKAILVLINCRSEFGSEQDRKLKLEAYWAVLSELPHEVIVDVCVRAGRGEIGDPARLPTAPELYQAACPRQAQKPSPDWRPHQERLMCGDGTLFLTEGGRTWVYTAHELHGLGYSFPRNLPRLPDLSQGSEAGKIEHAGVRKLIAAAVQKASM